MLFEELLKIIPKTDFILEDGTKLFIAEKPEIYVPPPLENAYFLDPNTNNSKDKWDFQNNVEVVILDAPAAVGKSIMAKYISAEKNIPILDLAEVGVSAEVLRGHLLNCKGPEDPILAFHKGRLPIIVDALDEGRLVSTEKSFVDFLETSARIIVQDPNRKLRLKLIMLGRSEAADETPVGLLVNKKYNTDVTVVRIRVAFFEKEQAQELVNKNALREKNEIATRNKKKRLWADLTVPEKDAITAYFDAIERALSIEKGKLWDNPAGRAFAGYAPVLEAVGKLIGGFETEGEVEGKETTNIMHLLERLKMDKSEAWDVIEQVIESIQNRERGKLTNALDIDRIPRETYDKVEQFEFLLRKVNGKALKASRRVSMSIADHILYMDRSKQLINEHPFIRGNEFANDVLGSIVMAYAVANQNEEIQHDMLIEYSRRPFLWRSIRQYCEESKSTPLKSIHGEHVGYILRSFWSDPSISEHECIIRSSSSINEEETSPIRVVLRDSEKREEYVFNVSPGSLTFLGSVENCDVDTDQTVVFKGVSSASAFNMKGRCCIIGKKFDFDVKDLHLDGKIWLEAENVINRQREMRMHIQQEQPGKQSNVQVGWKGDLKEKEPWNQIPSTLQPPYEIPPGNIFEELILECCRRLPDSGATLILNQNYLAPDEQRMRWVTRRFESTFPDLIKLMIKCDLASAEAFDRGGVQKLRIRFNATWKEIWECVQLDKAGKDCTGKNKDSRLQKLITQAKKQIINPAAIK